METDPYHHLYCPSHCYHRWDLHVHRTRNRKPGNAIFGRARNLAEEVLFNISAVGEHGRNLSGGQKQRIAIARSVVSDLSILRLDGATSALDSKAEGTVQKALHNVTTHRITIMIAN